MQLFFQDMQDNWLKIKDELLSSCTASLEDFGEMPRHLSNDFFRSTEGKFTSTLLRKAPRR